VILLDTNYILRFLLKDDDRMYEISKDCIKNNSCKVSVEVLCEVVFVLLKVYNAAKQDIKNSLIYFIGLDTILIDGKRDMLAALELFEAKNLDFVDCILCAKSTEYEIKTFDKKLNSCIQTRLYRDELV